MNGKTTLWDFWPPCQHILGYPIGSGRVSVNCAVSKRWNASEQRLTPSVNVPRLVRPFTVSGSGACFRSSRQRAIGVSDARTRKPSDQEFGRENYALSLCQSVELMNRPGTGSLEPVQGPLIQSPHKYVISHAMIPPPRKEDLAQGPLRAGGPHRKRFINCFANGM